MSKPRTVQELLNLATSYLKEQGCDCPRLDAEVLLGHVLGLDRLGLYMDLERPLIRQEIDNYRQLISKRGKRIPLAYIVGFREFYSLKFKVTPDVLIPRPETELLVDKAITLAKAWESPHILDVGTGSGIIAISLARALSKARVVAVDISNKALAVAEENARIHGVTQQLRFLRSDLTKELADERFNLICSNPPYIPSNEMPRLQQEVGKEPVLALDGGQQGVEVYKRLLSVARNHLIPGGYMILEIGWDQNKLLQQLAVEYGYIYCETIKDYAQKDRVMVFQWNT